MLAARVSYSLKHLLLNTRHHLIENCEISKRILLDRFRNGDGLTKHFRRVSFHGSVESDIGCVEKKEENPTTVLKVLTEKKKKKKKKSHEQASDSVSMVKLFTEKPDVTWRTNGKKKTQAHSSSSLERKSTDHNVSSSKTSSAAQEEKPKAQCIVNLIPETKKQISSKGSSSSSVIVIRISNLNSKTSDSMIHSMCSSIGSLEGLTRINDSTVDVLFRARNTNQGDSILEELNDATVDNSRWTAEIVPKNEEEGFIGMRISNSFEDLEKHFVMRRVLARDLEILLHSVMHLENHPMAREEC